MLKFDKIIVFNLDLESFFNLNCQSGVKGGNFPRNSDKQNNFEFTEYFCWEQVLSSNLTIC